MGRHQGDVTMELHLNDILELKKDHPCGSRRWQVLRVGMDIKLRCLGCGHEVMQPRRKVEKMIKRIVPPMSNEIITLVKDTSLARIIALQEIIWAGQAFMKGSQGIAGEIWPLFFTAVYYLIFNGVLTVLLERLERKLDYFR